MIERSTSTRPTRNRLLLATGIATAVVAALLSALGVLLDLSRSNQAGTATEGPLTVLIKRSPTEPPAEVSTGESISPASAREATPPFKPIDETLEIASADAQPAEVESRLAADWREIMTATAIDAVDEQLRLETKRASSWQRSRSIMFEPGDDIVSSEKEPVIPDFRFKPRMHVVGLGLNIGSCFFGIPLAGVPVDQRTVAISVFVCAPN